MGELKQLEKQLNVRAALRQEFKTRQERNAGYSLRAFAKYLGVDSSTLSHVLFGRRQASAAVIAKVSKRIKLQLETTVVVPNDDNFAKINEQHFSVISEWHHFAILDLTQLKVFKSDLNWMAKKLNLPVSFVKTAVNRLLDLGYLIIEDGKLKKAQATITNDLGDRTSEAKKEYQRQLLKLALNAVDHCPSSRKDITSITISGNPAKLELAKEKIKQFRRELFALLEDEQGEDVMHLAIQLYPVTIPEEKPNV